MEATRTPSTTNTDAIRVNVTVPVFNEERRLSRNGPRLLTFLRDHCRFDFELVIASNASTDATIEVAQALAATDERVRVVHLERKGRGRALKAVWTGSRAGILSYMDVDLSTDLAAFPPLVESLIGGGFDLAAGSRLLKPSLTSRGWKREMLSRSYNRLVRMLFRTGFSDAQCGFKALTRTAATELIPRVEDDGWFLDTELLILAERFGYRIFDLPVRWVDDTDTRVRIWSTAIADVRGLIRLRRSLARHRDRDRRASTVHAI
ncbi:MAG: glycosyltransferase family 2 protein [Verrucomicrobiae bacterium]|nr:glycosyltransferase family 2 protein [Verrucomicrobiae bacterium]